MGSRGRPASVDVDPQNESIQEVQHIVESNVGTQSITRKVPNQGMLFIDSLLMSYTTKSYFENWLNTPIKIACSLGIFSLI